MRLAALLLSIAWSLFAADGFAGKWELSATDPNGAAVTARITFEENSGAWSGEFQGPDGTVPLRSVSVKEDVLTCALTYEDTQVTLTLKLDGDHLKGRYEADAGPDGPVEGVRLAARSSVAGVWKLTTAGPDGDSVETIVTLKQSGAEWSGRIEVSAYGIDEALSDVNVEGSAVSFKVPTDLGPYSVKATVEGDRFSGTSVAPGGDRNSISGGREA